MAFEAHTTRRALFAMALPLGASLGLAALPSASLAEIAVRARAGEELVNSGHYGDDEDASNEAMDAVNELDAAVLAGPIRTRADAVTKLRTAHMSFERGNRDDGLDEAGVADVIRWLEAY